MSFRQLRDVWHPATDERRFYKGNCRTSADELTPQTIKRAAHAPIFVAGFIWAKKDLRNKPP